jgi:hypothetical protein
MTRRCEMAEKAVTARCDNCPNEIWKSMAGWVHTFSDTRGCIKISHDRSTYEMVEGKWAMPRLSQAERSVIAAVLPWEWSTAEILAMKARREPRSVRATLVGLRRKGFIEARVAGPSGELSYRRTPA